MFRPKITSGSVDLVQLWCFRALFWLNWPVMAYRPGYLKGSFGSLDAFQGCRLHYAFFDDLPIFQGMRVLVVRDFSKKFYPIRNCFGVFKNQQLPKKFVFCQNMREREECSYQNACLFSHSITEMAIWQIQKQSKCPKLPGSTVKTTIYFRWLERARSHIRQANKYNTRQ